MPEICQNCELQDVCNRKPDSETYCDDFKSGIVFKSNTDKCPSCEIGAVQQISATYFSCRSCNYIFQKT